MRCFYFIVLQAIALCIALPTWSLGSDYAIQTQKTRNINKDPSVRLHDVKLSRRDKVGCTHVGVVFGQVSQSGDDFKATYLHAKANYVRADWGTDVNLRWYQSDNEWHPRQGQKLMYDHGGRTTAEKADFYKVFWKGQEWVYDAEDKFDTTWNCLSYYFFLAKELVI
ncbi:hypothetical protein LZ31DRAFT_540633 [Colletotrichum somersetense]|nr:hypothetical protein LZ31DRAFT_540633 [Colletotrichum somersetense]